MKKYTVRFICSLFAVFLAFALGYFLGHGARGYVVIKILTNWKLLIQNVFYGILIAFGDQSNLFSIRLVTIYDLVIVLLQLFDCAIRII